MTAQQQYVTTVFPGDLSWVQGAARPHVPVPAQVPVRGGPPEGSAGGSASRVRSDDVLDLLDAAGALTVREIAGGLGVSERAAADVVAVMVERDWLRADEWGRLRMPERHDRALAA